MIEVWLANHSFFYPRSKFADRKLIICPGSYSLIAHICLFGENPKPP